MAMLDEGMRIFSNDSRLASIVTELKHQTRVDLLTGIRIADLC